VKNQVILTTEEFVTICALAYQAGKLQGEDTIGGLMKMGAFHVIGEDGNIVKLSRKIDDGRTTYNAMRDEVLKQKKEKFRIKK